MLSEEVKKYRELSGDTNPNTPISRIGGYLDGYEKALEQKPCDDAISREDALMCLTGEIKDTDTIETIIARSVRRIRKLPPVTPQPKTGKWNTFELFQGGIKETWYECPKCKWSNALLIPRNYCPNCGAKMIESQESKE